MTTNHEQSHSSVDNALVKSEAFWIKYRNRILYSAIGIGFAIGLLVGGYVYLQNQNEKAQELIGQGVQYLQAGDFDKALKGDGKTFLGYLRIAKSYSFTDGANAAKAYAGICLAQQGKKKEAISYLEDFSPSNDNSLSPAVLAALANCYASNNQVEKAIKTFKKAAKLADNRALSPFYLLQAGILLENQKKYVEAKEVYEQIKNDYPTSQLSATQTSPDGQGVTPAYIERYIERTNR